MTQLLVGALSQYAHYYVLIHSLPVKNLTSKQETHKGLFLRFDMQLIKTK